MFCIETYSERFVCVHCQDLPRLFDASGFPIPIKWIESIQMKNEENK